MESGSDKNISGTKFLKLPCENKVQQIIKYEEKSLKEKYSFYQQTAQRKINNIENNKLLKRFSAVKNLGEENVF